MKVVMNTGLKVTAFAAALAATFGAAYGVGKGVDPVVAKPASHAGHGESADGAGAGRDAPLLGGQHGGKVRTAAFTVHVGGHFAA